MGNSLFNNIFQDSKLSSEEIAKIKGNFVREVLEKGEHFLNEGQICTFIGILEEGLLMFYTIAENGEEKVCDFALDHQPSHHAAGESHDPSGFQRR